jgi:hypothetical protein
MWRAIVFTLIVTLPTQKAQAHCYHFWFYKTPQHCGGIYARPHTVPRVIRTNPVDSSVVDNTEPDIPLPDMSGIFINPLDTLEELQLNEQMPRLKGLRLLELEIERQQEIQKLQAKGE